MPAHPYFSASAGRIIRSHKHHYDNEPGVMGLKCPFSTSVTRRCPAELAKEYSNFCLEYNEEGTLALKEASPYYISNDYYSDHSMRSGAAQLGLEELRKLIYYL